MNTRYDDYIAIYGRGFLEKARKIKTFMCGAGAIGCELLKLLALMGVGCSDKGKVIVSDMDTIEVSNLSRQFLFNSTNVGHFKSDAACESAKQFNPDLNFESH